MFDSTILQFRIICSLQYNIRLTPTQIHCIMTWGNPRITLFISERTTAVHKSSYVAERCFSLDCLDTTKTPRAEDYDICSDKDLLDVNEQTDENQGDNRTAQVSLNVIEQTDDNEGNTEHNRTPRHASGNKGHSGDSVLSSGGGSRETVVIPGPGSPEEPLAVSSPLTSARDHDSGVYTAEDLFRDMLTKRGKGQ